MLIPRCLRNLSTDTTNPRNKLRQTKSQQWLGVCSGRLRLRGSQLLCLRRPAQGRSLVVFVRKAGIVLSSVQNTGEKLTKPKLRTWAQYFASERYGRAVSASLIPPPGS